MKTMKFWRSALVLTLVLSVMLSVTGGTIAWFTDSVTSANNEIKAGNLDVELEYWDGDSYEKVTADTKLFKENTLWEPGYTEVAYLKVTNAGSLALTYQLGVNVSETEGTNKAGEEFKLSEFLKFAVVESTDNLAGLYASRSAAQAAAALGDALTTTYSFKNLPENGDTQYLALVIAMPTTVGNEANHNGNAPTITLGVELEATQLAKESDSFGSDYDKDAQFGLKPGAANDVYTLTQKLATAQAGDVIEVLPGTYELDATLTIPNGVTLKGAQAGVPAAQWANANVDKTVITYNGNGGNVFEIRQTAEGKENAVGNITIDGILIDGNNKASKGIYTKKSDGEAMENIKIVNCAVINTTNNGIDVCNTYGAVIENNYVANVADKAIHLGSYNGYHYETWAEVTAYVCNNVIENVSATEGGAIMLENGMGDVVVSGNTVKNVVTKGGLGSSSDKASAITIYDVYEGGEILVENNTVENVDQGIVVYKYTYGTYYGEDWWEGPTSNNDSVTIKANTIKNFNTFGIKTSTLNAKSTANHTTVDILNNTLVSTATDNAVVISDGNSNWTVTSTGNTLNGAALGDKTVSQ